MKIILFVFVSGAFCLAAPPEIRFRRTEVRGTAADVARQSAKVKQFGLINRVRYRIVQGSRAAVEREPVTQPAPQRGAVARSAAAGAPWIRESVTPAPAGAQIIGWGDFDNDGCDELLSAWPATSGRRATGPAWA